MSENELIFDLWQQGHSVDFISKHLQQARKEEGRHAVRTKSEIRAIVANAILASANMEVAL